MPRDPCCLALGWALNACTERWLTVAPSGNDHQSRTAICCPPRFGPRRASPRIRRCQHQHLRRQHGKCLCLSGSGGVGGGEDCPGAAEGSADDDVARLPVATAAAGGAARREAAAVQRTDGATWNSAVKPGFACLNRPWHGMASAVSDWWHTLNPEHSVCSSQLVSQSAQLQAGRVAGAAYRWEDVS